MRFVNVTDGPVYCAAANDNLQPGQRTRELKGVKEALRALRKGSGGLPLLLSGEDLAEIESLLAAHRRAEEAVKAYSGPVQTETPMERELRLTAMRDAAIRAEREERDRREAAIQAESMAAAAGSSDSASLRMAALMKEGLDPKRHDGMGRDLSSILENNMAIRGGENG